MAVSWTVAVKTSWVVDGELEWMTVTVSVVRHWDIPRVHGRVRCITQRRRRQRTFQFGRRHHLSSECVHIGRLLTKPARQYRHYVTYRCCLQRRTNYPRGKVTCNIGRGLQPISCVHCIGDGRFYRAMVCIRGTSHYPVSVSVRLSQVGVLSKRLNESSWVLACKLPSTRTTLC